MSGTEKDYRLFSMLIYCDDNVLFVIIHNYTSTCSESDGGELKMDDEQQASLEINETGVHTKSSSFHAYIQLT